MKALQASNPQSELDLLVNRLQNRIKIYAELGWPEVGIFAEVYERTINEQVEARMRDLGYNITWQPCYGTFRIKL